MKSQTQNTAEVMNYLKNSSNHLFMSEDGTKYQTIQPIGEGYVLIKNDEVHIIDIDKHLGYYPTEGRTKLKQRFHPTWNVNEKWHKGYGMGPGDKPKSVRWFKAMEEKIEKIISEFETKKTDQHNI
jgi:hypothetical protein